VENTAIRRITITLFASRGLFSAAQIACTTLLSIVAVDLSGSKQAAGIPSTISTFSWALVAFPMGILMDNYGRRNGLMMGYVAGVVGCLLGGIAIIQHSYGLLLLGVILLGISRSGSEQSRFIAAEIYPENRRGKIIGTIIFASTLGAIGGPALIAPSGYFVHTYYDFPKEAGPWLFSAGLMAVTTLATFLLLRPDPRDFKQAEETLERSELPPRPLKIILQSAQVQVAIVAMLIGQFVMVLLMVITPLHMQNHSHSLEAISVVFMAHTLGMFGLSNLTGYLIDRFGRVNMIIGGAVVLLLSATLAPLSSATLALVMALFLLGLGWNFCYIGGSSLLSDALTQSERGKTQGMNEAMVAFASGVASLSSGFIFDAGGFVAVSVIGLVIVLILTGYIGSYAPRQVEQMA
ncbi:MAG: MFS transporter, partial [Anaerolineae bacterium]|nr:MFS transporter [Anaerolineae bacterium]